MPPKKIEEFEIERYWEIFSSLSNGGTHLDGSQAASVLKNSQLSETQLEKIWDLADIDNDGRLDFEEFCVAMRLIFDLVNGEMKSIPNAVPDWLVPSSKTDLVQASRALSGSLPQFVNVDVDDDDEESAGLKSGFDWYMPPADKAKYEEIYSAHSNSRGDVEFSSLQGLYDSLDVPDTDVRSAWNLVNPKSELAIGKPAALAFLHILNNRHEGFRIPRTVPPSLRSSFERNHIDYQVDRVPSPAQRGRYDDNTSTGRKTKFGDTYLSRLGLGGSASSYSKKTDFGGKEDADWEEVRLKKQLAEMDAKIKRVEERAEDKRRRRAGGDRESKPALVKRELQQLLDWKRKELRDLELGEGRAKEGENMKNLRSEVDSVREQVEGLERHWKERQKTLDGLRDEVQAAQRA